MFCPKCGTNFADDGKFCPNCGFKIAKKPAPVSETSQATTPTVSKKPMKNKGLIIGLSIGAGALLVALIVCLVVVFVLNNKVSAKVNLVISDYNDGICTRIPVNVEGNNVDETMYINAGGEGLELKNGEYELSFPASPLSMTGKFWNNPTDKYKMTLKDGKFENYEDTKIEFKTADLEKVTDKQIDIAAEFAKYDNEGEVDIDECVKNTKEARDKAVKEDSFNKKKDQLKYTFVSGDYASVDNPNWIFRLDVEGRKYQIIDSGKVVGTGRILEEKQVRDSMRLPGYWSEYICFSGSSGTFFVDRNNDGIEVHDDGYEMFHNELSKYYKGSYRLIS